MKQTNGFSFFELAIVILLLFVVSMSWLFFFGGKTEEARDVSRIERLNSVEKILLDVFVTDGRYPSEDEFGQILDNYPQFDDPLVGQNRCLDAGGQSERCGYEYYLGNKGFDYLIVSYFETIEHVDTHYEVVTWERDQHE